MTEKLDQEAKQESEDILATAQALVTGQTTIVESLDQADAPTHVQVPQRVIPRPDNGWSGFWD